MASSGADERAEFSASSQAEFSASSQEVRERIRELMERTFLQREAARRMREDARRMLAEDEDGQALDTFRFLQQRIASVGLEALELDGDPADSPGTTAGGAAMPNEGYEKYLEALRDGASPQDRGTPITYALVNPDGSLEFRTETARAMRDKVGSAGSGTVDRVGLPDPPTVHAYVAELPPATAELANPVANEMLSLLGSCAGPFFGPISFFGVHPDQPGPGSLDDAHQDLLRAAHQVAQARSSDLQ